MPAALQRSALHREHLLCEHKHTLEEREFTAGPREGASFEAYLLPEMRIRFGQGITGVIESLPLRNVAGVTCLIM